MTHELEGAPITAAQVGLTDARMQEGGGGWAMILSDLKTLLETGSPLGLAQLRSQAPVGGREPRAPRPPTTATSNRCSTPWRPRRSRPSVP